MVQRGATPHDKQKLAIISKRVASSVTEIVHAAEAIKGRAFSTYLKCYKLCTASTVCSALF